MPQKKKRKRRLKRGFFILLLTVVALIFVFVLTGGLFFKVREIRVEGVTVTDKQEIIDLTGFSYGETIFFIDKGTASRNIRSNNPYVREVRIRRELPGTVVVIVTEAAPAAMIEYMGNYWIFDAQGSLLEYTPVHTAPDLPVIKGMELLDPLAGTKLYPAFDDAAKRDPLLGLIQTMQAEDVWEDVSEVDITLLSNIRFTYMERYRVELGMPEALEEKLRIMLEALKTDEIKAWASGTFLLADVAEGKNVRFVPDR
jgi:cell division protein FtsQ